MADAEQIPTTPGGWQTLVLDPPWRFENTAARGAVTYETMSDDEIVRMPIAMITAPRAHLYMWTTDAHLELAMRCMRDWGFVYKHPFVWVKTANDGGLRIMGGNYGRKAHELVLFGVRGGLPVLRKDIPTVFFAPPRKPQSRKPVTLHEIAEQLSPGPRLEMFARARRDGWTSWGRECPPAPETDEGEAHLSPRARFTQWIETVTFDEGRTPTEDECRRMRQRFEAEERAARRQVGAAESTA